MEFVNLGSSRRAAIGAGIFLLVGVGVVLVWAVINFGGITGRTSYSTVLPNVSGLRAGANVEVAGYQVGSVTKVEPDFSVEGTRFRVQLSILPDWEFPDDTVAMLSRPNPIAAPVIALRIGASPTALEPGSTIPATTAPGLEGEVSALLASVSSLVQEQITPLVATLRGASDNLAAHVEDNLPPILYDVRHLVARVDGVVAQVQSAVQQAEADLGTVGEGMTEVIGAIDVDRINTTLAALTDAATRLDSVLAGAEQLIVHGDQLVVDAGTVLTEIAPDIEVLTSDARYALQSASPRLNTILVNLERATEDLAGLLAELRANPAVLIGVEGAERSPGR